MDITRGLALAIIALVASTATASTVEIPLGEEADLNEQSQQDLRDMITRELADRKPAILHAPVLDESQPEDPDNPVAIKRDEDGGMYFDYSLESE